MARRISLVLARQALDLTQEQIAERLQIGQSTICRIERGEAIPSAKLAAKLIQLLGVTLEDVIAPPTITKSVPSPSRPARKPRRARVAA